MDVLTAVVFVACVCEDCVYEIAWGASAIANNFEDHRPILLRSSKKDVVI